MNRLLIRGSVQSQRAQRPPLLINAGERRSSPHEGATHVCRHFSADYSAACWCGVDGGRRGDRRDASATRLSSSVRVPRWLSFSCPSASSSEQHIAAVESLRASPAILVWWTPRLLISSNSGSRICRFRVYPSREHHVPTCLCLCVCVASRRIAPREDFGNLAVCFNGNIIYNTI